MLPLEVIKEYYPNLSDEDLKRIQVFVYQLCCGVMQYFYGDGWKGILVIRTWKIDKVDITV